MSEIYKQWIKEDLDYAQKLRSEIDYWQGVLKHNVFNKDWTRLARAAISVFETEVIKQIEECHYYLEQMRKERNGELNLRQSGKNEDNVGVQGERAGDTYQESTGIEPEALGIA